MEQNINFDRIQRILKSEKYRKYVKKNEKAERERKFCRHGMVHFLDVARIARIINDEEKLCVSTELIYAAALVHDIGRFRQYEDNIPHEKAGAMLAREILTESGFDENETEEICQAVLSHRDSLSKERKDLTGLLYRADKLSRPCFFCKEEENCNWKDDKKNLDLLY